MNACSPASMRSRLIIRSGGIVGIWAYLHFGEQLPNNKKRMLQVMREYHFLVKPNVKLKAKRKPSRSMPRPTHPNEWWGIDMTKVLVDGFGWAYIVLVVDWYTKRIVGYDASMPCTEALLKPLVHA